ncbi:MAG: adenylosuccinate lyase family protein [Rhodospirillaceae bacterium]
MAHIIDHAFYKDSWGTPEMRAVFGEYARFQRWLDIEAALAEIQAGLGVIPESAAMEIRAKATVDNIKPERMQKELAKTGHTLVALLNELELACTDGAGEWIHYGPTTQDIQDTGTAIEMRDAWRIIFTNLKRLETACLDLADKYASLTMVGRTHGQHGLPMTLGMKVAGWAAEVRRDLERLKDLPPRAFFVMMHGGVGTQASFGGHADAIMQGLAQRFDLYSPPTCWASARDGIAEFQTVLGITAGTVGRIANEIFELSRTEVGEVHESLPDSVVGSSTMPHKRNAVRAEFTGALTRIVINNALLGLQGMEVEHERDTRCWRLDWHSIPESACLLDRAIVSMTAVVSGLEVDRKAIARNLKMTGGAILSEAVMFRLGEKLGKQSAHHLLHAATAEALHSGKTFREAVLSQPKIAAALTPDELENMMNYGKYTGTATAQVAAVRKLSRELSACDPL